MAEALRYARMDAPVGALWLASTARGLAAVEFDAPEARILAGWRRRFGAEAVRDDAALTPAVDDFQRYFDGSSTRFQVPLDVLVGTPFQRRAWEALRRIPYGETRSYKWLAEQAGHPRGFRAAGMANHRNPMPIVVPCHRVVNADGRLGGYGGGLPLKRALLRLEGALPA